VASWRYSEVPPALGCNGWFTARLSTCGELDQAISAAERGDSAANIEVVTDTYAASPLWTKLRKSVKTLYPA
jgi:indolepyruvate decarboxylase